MEKENVDMEQITVGTTITREQRKILMDKAISIGLKLNAYLRMLIENDLGIHEPVAPTALEKFVRRIVQEEIQSSRESDNA